VYVCDFLEVAIVEITVRFFKFVWEILPIQPTIQTWAENQHPPPPPLYLEDENIFQKSATMVPRGIAYKPYIAVELVPSWPISGKCSHLREKGGALTLLKTNHHLKFI
jgi:hypothetical protein